MKSLSVVIVLLFLPFCAFANTHYVSPYGNDTYPYTTWGTAADSIQKGIDAASSGDTVRVGAGTYREIVMMIPGIVLLGAGMDSSIIYPYKNSGLDIVWGADSSVIEGFHIRGWEPLGGDYHGGVRSASDSKLEKIADNKISDCNSGVYLGIAATEISNNIIVDNGTGLDIDLGFTGVVISNTMSGNNYGINLLYPAAPRIAKNVIIAGPGDTRGIWGDFRDSIFIENNLIVGYGAECVSLSKSSGEFETAPIRNNTLIGESNHTVIDIGAFSNEIKNNIISEGFYGIAAYNYDGYECNPQVSYNDLWNNEQDFYEYGGAIIDTSLGGNIYLDPMFLGGDDYHLQYGSPCIDAGDPGIKDPDSSKSDIGCYGGAYGETYTYQDYPPQAPDSLSAISESTVTILSWKPNTESDLSGYLVYRDTLGGFLPDTFKIVANISRDSSVFRDYDIILGKTYYYRVSARDSSGNQSEYSDELEVMATSVDEYQEEDNRPPLYRLFQNYPNPFNSSTVVWYYLPDVGYQPAEVELTIYNLLGKRVRTLIKRSQYPGEYKVRWDGKDDFGEEVASGIYFCRLKVSGLELVKPRKMLLLR
jgi:nitrous oxidase accessory protein NosD